MKILFTPDGGATPQGGSSAAENRDIPGGNAMERLVQMQGAMDPEDAGTAEREVSPKLPGEGGGTEGGAEDGGAAPEDGGVVKSDQEDQTVLSQAEREAGAEGGEPTDEGAEGAGQMPAELAALPEDVRTELLKIAADVAAGKANFGDIKRGSKLLNKHAEEVQQLKDTVAQLEEQVKTATSTPAATMPETVARLQSVAEVDKRTGQLEKVMDWCEDNPEGGEFNGQQFTAEDVKAARKGARDEMRQLPQRKAQLQQASQFRQQQQQVRAQVLADFPELKDPEHPTTQKVTQVLTQQPWMKNAFASPEAAALRWLLGGDALNARKKGGTAQSPKPKVQGGAERGRPGGGGGAPAGGAARKAGGPTVNAAKERIEKERSVGALADLMGAAKVG